MAEHERPAAHRFGLRWAALGLATAVGGAALAVTLTAFPANAATTVAAQLTLSGVASASTPTGGSTVGVHPGDSVVLTAAGVPTAGAPGALGSTLGGVLGAVAGFDVVLQSGNLPGVSYPYTLGSDGCAGAHASLSLPALAAGTYSFSYTAESVSVLPLLGTCSLTQILLSGDQIKTLTHGNIAINAQSTYAGQIVAAVDPPAGGISIQLPTIKVAPKVGPVQLPTLTVPGVTTPTIPTDPSKLLPKTSKTTTASKAPSTSKAPASSSSSSGLTYTPNGLTVPEQVMPQANSGGFYGGALPQANGGTLIGSSLPDSGGAATNATAGGKSSGTDAKATKGSSTAPNAKQTTIELASDKPSSTGQMPVLLAIIAVIALTLVTATYARLFLLRRH